MTLPYNITEPSAPELPLVLSVPHCGTAFPDSLRNEYKQELIAKPDDTDWFVDELYAFAPSLGMTVITAVYNRWVIDLNRDPKSKPLYTDGRIVTALCPTTNFLGTPIYRNHRTEVDAEDVDNRLQNIYWPYHQKLQELITNKKMKFGFVVLWDCHSIRQEVPSIQSGKFPDLILGDVDETSASPLLIETALQSLQKGPYTVNHNHPFKGGYITRAYGDPKNNVHALQLEMTKVNYMDETESNYHPAKAAKMQSLLITTLQALAKNISAL
ncbi:MAG TPA: N-formylglutamate amidohydrolase [Chryseosolibacter sp.]